MSRYLTLPHKGICILQPFLSVQTKHKRLLDTCSKGCSAAYSNTMSTSQGKMSTSSLMQVSVGQQRDRAIPEDLLHEQHTACVAINHPQQLTTCLREVCTYSLILWPLHKNTIMMTAVLQERMDFLEEDLQHLFDDQGIDKSQYNDRVEFRDPITSYNDVSGDQYLCASQADHT